MYVASMNTRRSSVGVGVVDGKTEVCVTWVTSYVAPMKSRNSDVTYFNARVCVYR